MARLSGDFLAHFYYGLRADYQERINGEKKPLPEIFLGLTRNNPVVLTCDKQFNPNGAVKSVGFHVRDEFLDQSLAAYDEFLNWRWKKIKETMGGNYKGEGWLYSPHPDFIVEGLKHALQHIYLPGEEAEKRIEFEILGTLEGFNKKTWSNIQQNKKVAIGYYYPPGIHFQSIWHRVLSSSGSSGRSVPPFPIFAPAPLRSRAPCPAGKDNTYCTEKQAAMQAASGAPRALPRVSACFCGVF